MNGVVVDFGKFIAEKLGVAFDPVVYVNQEAYAQRFGKGEWDIIIGVRSALAEATTDMSPDFMVADAMYIAAPGQEFADATKIDRLGVRVGVSQGGGSDQILSRALQSAQVVRVPGGVPNAVEALRTGTADVWAANPVTLREIEDALPGSKVVPGAWTTGRYATSLPKGRSAAAQNKLAEIVSASTSRGRWLAPVMTSTRALSPNAPRVISAPSTESTSSASPAWPSSPRPTWWRPPPTPAASSSCRGSSSAWQ